MENRYLRNLPALTQAECETLQTKKVLVVGCGGLGGYLMEYLARIGIGSIRCVDGDVFEETNFNRQLLATAETLGAAKALTAAHRLRLVNPNITVEPVCEFLGKHNAKMGLPDGFDVIKDEDIPQMIAWARKEANPLYPVPVVWGEKDFRRLINKIRR